MRAPSGRAGDGFDAVASVVERLAVLCDAGLSPLSAWRHAGAEAETDDSEAGAGGLSADSGDGAAHAVRVARPHRAARGTGTDAASAARTVAAQVAATAETSVDVPAVLAEIVAEEVPAGGRFRGEPVVDRNWLTSREMRTGRRSQVGRPSRPPHRTRPAHAPIRSGAADETRAAWRAIAAAWAVAAESGAPLSPTLARCAGVLRDLADSARDIETALAGPTASGRIVLALPVVGVLFSLALGMDTLGVLVGTPAGWACLVCGIGLVLIARTWTRSLVGRARSADVTPGLSCELAAIAVAGGAALTRARALVSRVLDEMSVAAPRESVDQVLAFARTAGVPVAALLIAEASVERRRARSEARRQAAALGVRLMLPLGVCVLPAFLILGVVPVAISLVTATAGMTPEVLPP